jgi:hypothetical protein
MPARFSTLSLPLLPALATSRGMHALISFWFRCAASCGIRNPIEACPVLVRVRFPFVSCSPSFPFLLLWMPVLFPFSPADACPVPLPLRSTIHRRRARRIPRLVGYGFPPAGWPHHRSSRTANVSAAPVDPACNMPGRDDCYAWSMREPRAPTNAFPVSPPTHADARATDAHVRTMHALLQGACLLVPGAVAGSIAETRAQVATLRVMATKPLHVRLTLRPHASRSHCPPLMQRSRR